MTASCSETDSSLFLCQQFPATIELIGVPLRTIVRMDAGTLLFLKPPEETLNPGGNFPRDDSAVGCERDLTVPVSLWFPRN